MTTGRTPIDLSQVPSDNLKERSQKEAESLGLVDWRNRGRKHRRDRNVMVKTTAQKRKLLQDLSDKTGKSLTVVFEMALDALDEKLRTK